MPIRTARFTPGQKAQCEAIDKRHAKLVDEYNQIIRDWRALATEVLGPYNESAGEIPQLSADWESLNLTTAAELDGTERRSPLVDRSGIQL